MKWHVVADHRMNKKASDFANTMRMNGYGVTVDTADSAKTDTAMEELAMEAFDKIVRSDALVIFTSTGQYPSLKRQTILGIALALNKRIVLIGTNREQPFHFLEMVVMYRNVNDFLDSLVED